MNYFGYPLTNKFRSKTPKGLSETCRICCGVARLCNHAEGDLHEVSGIPLQVAHQSDLCKGKDPTRSMARYGSTTSPIHSPSFYHVSFFSSKALQPLRLSSSRSGLNQKARSLCRHLSARLLTSLLPKFPKTGLSLLPIVDKHLPSPLKTLRRGFSFVALPKLVCSTAWSNTLATYHFSTF